VLSELLQTMGFETRIAQMKVQDLFGGHILVEVLTHEGWVVPDASFDLYFVSKTGRLASFSEVSDDWLYFRSQAPAGYKMDYCYKDVRYTNWNKIPVVMPLARQVLVVFMGEQKVEGISIRPILLRKFRVYCCVIAGFLIFCLPLLHFIPIKFYAAPSLPISV
jgi:hypothetical protein